MKQNKKELEASRQEKLKRYTEAGITPIIQALNNQLQLDEGLIKLPEMQSEDFDFFDLDATDRAQFKENKIIPFISDYLQKALGDLEFTSETLKAMEQQDFNNLLRQVSEQFRGTSNTFSITPIDIQNAIKAITKGN